MTAGSSDAQLVARAERLNQMLDRVDDDAVALAGEDANPDVPMAVADSFEATEAGVTRSQLITILQKLSDQTAVATECAHMAAVLDQEKAWREKQAQAGLGKAGAGARSDGDVAMGTTENGTGEAGKEEAEEEEQHEITTFARKVVGMTKHAPVRLTLAERQVLKILEAALQVSEYTDKVDCMQIGRNKSEVICEQIHELCNCIAGMLVSHSYDRAMRFFGNKEEKAKLAQRDKGGENNQHKISDDGEDTNVNELLFQKVYELGRRAKILNPSQMKTTYGKMMWLLMDSSRAPIIQKMNGFECVGRNTENETARQVRTVFELLMEKDRQQAEAFLKEPLLEAAIVEVGGLVVGRSQVGEEAGTSVGGIKNSSKFQSLTREEVRRQVEQKHKAVEYLTQKYGGSTTTPPTTSCPSSVADWMKEITTDANAAKDAQKDKKKMSREDVDLILKSLQDHHAYIDQYVSPVAKMLDLLYTFFELELKPMHPVARHFSEAKAWHDL
eukprot:g10240.t1